MDGEGRNRPRTKTKHSSQGAQERGREEEQAGGGGPLSGTWEDPSSGPGGSLATWVPGKQRRRELVHSGRKTTGTEELALNKGRRAPPPTQLTVLVSLRTSRRLDREEPAADLTDQGNRGRHTCRLFRVHVLSSCSKGVRGKETSPRKSQGRASTLAVRAGNPPRPGPARLTALLFRGVFKEWGSRPENSRGCLGPGKACPSHVCFSCFVDLEGEACTTLYNYPCE